MMYFDYMFKGSKTTGEIDLFKGSSQHFTGRKFKDLTDEKAWYNVFYEEITSQVDEKIFKEIYSSKMGRPNASIRILVSMIILKEGQDWTDEQLYENCRYNLAVMRALGLTNIDDEVPVPSTYYDFKSKLVSYHDSRGINLIEELFRSLTSTQVKKYKVNGTSVRMDSKLIHSNLCKSSRLFKLLQAFQTFYHSIDNSKWQRVKKKRDQEFIESLMSKSATNHVYGMKKEEEVKMLRNLGFLLKKLLNIFSPADSKYYETLQQMYHEQYEDAGNKGEDPRPRDKGEMESASIQSIHDTDAAYRIKGHGRIRQKVSGYSSNITETTEGPLKLITDVQVEKANFSDDKYLEKAIRNTVEITEQTIEKVYTDGGYDSQENRMRFKENIGQEWHLTKNKGGSEFQFKKQKDESLSVYDPVEKKWLKATQTESGKYRISIGGRSAKYRYYTRSRVESMLALQKVRPKHIDKGKRANMESTINQVFHILRGKSKYRGLMRHKIFATSRSLWVNCRRIARFRSADSSIFDQIWTFIRSSIFFLSNRSPFAKA
jgi:transposase